MRKRISKKLIIVIIVCIASLAVSAAAYAIFAVTGNMLTSQTAARRWRGESDNPYAQVSCLMPPEGNLTPNEIYTFRTALNSKMIEASLEAEEGGSLWNDAYSAIGNKLTAYGEQGLAELTATGTGGDFFFFHPLRLLSGNYIKEDDLMHDNVVLDENAAWLLFGSSDVTGFKVSINGLDYRIAGVVESESDKYSKKTFSGGARVYMQYEELLSIVNDLTIGVYEIVMPEPVSGFAVNTMETIFPLGDGELIENSGRYDLGALWKVLTRFSERTIRTGRVSYPYWENAARLAENKMALLLPFIFLPLLIPAGITVYIAGGYIRRISRRIRSLIREYREFG